MISDHDNYYQQDNYYGEPSPEIIELLKKINPKANLLDIGCGQGRYAIPLALSGYQVTGIDISATAINQLLDSARRLNLNMQLINDDIYAVSLSQLYQVIFLGFFIQSDPKEFDKYHLLLTKLKSNLQPSGMILLCIWPNQKVKLFIEKTAAGLDMDCQLKSVYERFENGNKNDISQFDLIILQSKQE